jgi:hypothetical protein
LEPGVDLQKVGRALLAGRAAAVPVSAGDPLWNGITTDPPRPGEPIMAEGVQGRVVYQDILPAVNPGIPMPRGAKLPKASR